MPNLHCQICSQHLLSYSELINHIKQNHNITEDREILLVLLHIYNINNTSTATTSSANDVTSTTDILLTTPSTNNSTSADNVSNTITTVNTSSSSISAITSTIETKHICTDCSIIFHSAETLLQHYKRTHPVTCEICGKTYKNRQSFYSHRSKFHRGHLRSYEFYDYEDSEDTEETDDDSE